MKEPQRIFRSSLHLQGADKHGHQAGRGRDGNHPPPRRNIESAGDDQHGQRRHGAEQARHCAMRREGKRAPGIRGLDQIQRFHLPGPPGQVLPEAGGQRHELDEVQGKDQARNPPHRSRNPRQAIRSHCQPRSEDQGCHQLQDEFGKGRWRSPASDQQGKAKQDGGTNRTHSTPGGHCHCHCIPVSPTRLHRADRALASET